MSIAGNEEQARISLAQAGDLEAFNQLVLEYQDMVFSVAYRIMNESASAADATQETMLTAYRRLDTYRGGSFKAWLARIATNTCYDELRRRKRRPVTYLEDLNAPEIDDEPPIASESISPEQSSLDRELREAIEACIRALKEDQRMVLILSDVQGMSYQEIADELGTRLGTIKSRLSRARVGVQRCLQHSKELLPEEYRLGNSD